MALVPANLAALQKLGVEVLIEAGAGASAGFRDAAYVEKGGEARRLARGGLRRGRAGAARARPLRRRRRRPGSVCRRARRWSACWTRSAAPQGIEHLAQRGATAFALELIPRITRAQSMDVLSSMATIAGYKAVLLAADALPRMFPMMMTAAGTHHARARVRDRRRRRGAAGHRHGAPPGRRGRGLRRAPGGQGAGREPGRQVRRAAARDAAIPRTRAATPRRWTRSSTGSSARPWPGSWPAPTW